MKRTLMLKNQELLDFEIDLAAGRICIQNTLDLHRGAEVDIRVERK